MRPRIVPIMLVLGSFLAAHQASAGALSPRVVLTAPDRAAVAGLQVTFQARAEASDGHFILYAADPGEALALVGEWAVRPGVHRYSLHDGDPCRGNRHYRLTFRTGEGREVVLLMADAVTSLRSSGVTTIPSSGPWAALASGTSGAPVSWTSLAPVATFIAPSTVPRECQTPPPEHRS